MSFLEDINPQLFSTIQSEFDKVEGVPAPEPTRTSVDVVAMAPTNVASSAKGRLDPLEDLFPRVEIDTLLKGTSILANAKSDAWKSKKEALETLQAILDQGTNKRLKPTMGTQIRHYFRYILICYAGEIGQVLKARVVDTNKVVQTLALDIVARIATGMGKPFEKHVKFFVVPVAAALSDQKAPIRAAAIQTLTAIAIACEGLDPMVHFLGTALETTNPTQRASLLGWIADFIKEHPITSPLDLGAWAGTVVACLDDRSADVRKGAQALLPALITSVGFDKVMAQTNSLKPASRKTAIPLIQAAKDMSTPSPTTVAPPAVKTTTRPAPTPAPVPTTASATPPTPAPLPPSPTSPSSPPSTMPNKPTGVRRKLPQGTSSNTDSKAEPAEEPTRMRMPGKLGTTGLKRPGVPGVAKIPTLPFVTALPFTSMNIEAKRSRLAKDAQKWVNESGPVRKDLADLLQHQMELHTSKDLVGQLFSHDHNAVNDHVTGLSTMYEFFSAAESGSEKYGDPSDIRALGLACSDLALKYVSIKVHEPQSNLVTKCLDVVAAVISFFLSLDAQIEDAEALCFVPTLIHKVSLPVCYVLQLIQPRHAQAWRCTRACSCPSPEHHSIPTKGLCIQ